MDAYEQMKKMGYVQTNQPANNEQEPIDDLSDLEATEVVSSPKRKRPAGKERTQQAERDVPQAVTLKKEKIVIFNDITESEVDVIYKSITEDYVMLFIDIKSPVKITATKGTTLFIRHEGNVIKLYSPGVRVKVPIFECEVVLLLVDNEVEE